MIEDLLSNILEAHSVAAEAKSLIGRTYGVQLGVVSDRLDPLSLGRVKATTANKGARAETDWLIRLEPCPGLSLPVPNLGDTVIIAYQDGDPHKGNYLGVAQNLLNPAFDKDSLLLVVGKVSILVSPTAVQILTGHSSVVFTEAETLITQGMASLSLKDTGAFALNQITNFSFNGAPQWSYNWANLGQPWTYPD